MAASWEASDWTRSLKRDAARAARHCHRRLPDHAESRARFTTLANVVSSHQWVVGHRGAATHVIAHRHREIVSSGTPYPARVWEPEYSLSSAGAPVDSKLKKQTSNVLVSLFVVHGCMSRLRWQLPASCDQYHGKRDGLSISGWPTTASLRRPRRGRFQSRYALLPPPPAQPQRHSISSASSTPFPDTGFTPNSCPEKSEAVHCCLPPMR